MRIGIDASRLRVRVGGVRSYTVALAAALARLGHEVVFFSYGPEEDAVPPIRVVSRPPRFGPIKCRGAWQQAILPFMARRSGTQVLHFPADVGVSLLKTCPFVATIHDAYPFAMPDLYTDRQGRRLRGELMTTARRADALITDSEQSRSDLVKHLGIPAAVLTVVPLAPRDCFFPIADCGELDRLRAEMGLPQRFLLCVGGKNNKTHKNFGRVLEALTILSDRSDCRDVGLVVVGQESGYVQELVTTASRSGMDGRIRLTGVIDDRTLCALYNMASVFVFPSLYEGFGLPALEAMACGTPTVTSDYGAMKEVGGDAAVQVDPLDPGAIAEAVGLLLSDQGHRDDVAARCLSRSREFSWRKTAEKTLEVYASVLRQPGASS